MPRIRTLIGCLTIVLTAAVARADTFGSGANEFSIPFVTIGDPGNVADTTGDPNPAGAVPYVYRIGKFEVPEEAIRKANAITAAAGTPLAITLDERGPQKPATRISWFEAARFVNFLNEEKGAQPAYKFDDGPEGSGEFRLWEPGDPGYDPNNRFRNALAKYFLPSADEWYKAAFFDPVTDQWFDYPNGSNTPPTPVASGSIPGTAVFDQPFDQGPADVKMAGGESPLATVGQAGNVWEWEETEVDLVNDDPIAVRGFRGSDWGGGGGDNPGSLSSSFRHFIQAPSRSVADIGFRVAAVVPEPNGACVALLCSLTLTRRSVGGWLGRSCQA